MEAAAVGTSQWMLTSSGIERAAGTVVNAPAVDVVVRSGHRLVAAPGIEVLAARDRNLQMMRLDQLRQADFAVVRYGGTWPAASPPLEGFVPAPAYGSQKRIDIPRDMSEDLAFFLGAYVSEGHVNRTNWSVVITNAVPEVLVRVAAAAEAVFCVPARVVRPPTRCSYVVIASKRLVEFIDFLGCGARSQVKRIPSWVLGSSWSHVRAFMEGLFLDAFTAWMGETPKWGLSVGSPGLLDDVQAVLTNLGVLHGRCEKRDAATGNLFGEVYAVGEHAQALLRAVPFAEPDKRARAEERLLATPAQSTADVVPIVEPAELADLIPRAPRGQRSRTSFGFLRDPRTKNVSRRTLERVAALPGVEVRSELRAVLEQGLHFVPVTAVSRLGGARLVPIGPLTHIVGGFVRGWPAVGCRLAYEGAAAALHLRPTYGGADG
jgi:hypothetical protein